jgi:L-asparagine transporter-like permease
LLILGTALLLNLVVVFVIERHAFTHYFDRVEVGQPDWLVARGTDVAGLMVNDLAVRQRGARCL